VLVLGDSMADWLAYGLEDAFGDPPDLAVVRKNRAGSGLIRYDSRNEREDWVQVIRETIAATRPKFVVMMVGQNDRVSIRDRVAQATQPAGAAAKTPVPPAGSAPDQPAPAPDVKPEAADAEQTPGDQPGNVAPETQTRGGVTTTTYRVYEFRTDEWAATYTKRIDATIAALKSAGVPVFWVGLPSIRGPKSTSDLQYLNDLYRARVEKAGLSYIDVWDGFVDDSGRFIPEGPDFEGQIRRLRAGDGVHFTRAGARKLAHYLEREIRRRLAPGSEPVALPSSEPQAPAIAARPSGAAARPLAGPVVPLTVSVTSAQELIGPRDTGDTSTPKSVTRVLVNGEAVLPPAGRSDDFAWPRRAIAPVGADPVVATTTEPIPVMRPAPQTTVAANPPPPRRTVTTGRAQSQAGQQPSRNQGFFSFFR
jgi:lysophospholipase L1-like esterase